MHSGGPPQHNIVLVEGQQAILLQILKAGDASTLAVVAGTRARLPDLLKTLPAGVTIAPLNDVSQLVRASIEDVAQEMVTAAALAGLYRESSGAASAGMIKPRTQWWQQPPDLGN